MEVFFCPKPSSPIQIGSELAISTETLAMRLLVTSILLFICFSLQAQVWDLRRNDDGIMVYTRDASGDYRYRSVMVITKVNAGLSEAVALIMNPERYNEWIYKCESAQTLEKKNENQIIHYQVNSVPFAKDRDMVIQLEKTDNANGTVTITQKALNGYMDPKSDLVRIQVFEGMWELTAVNGATDIKYSISTDPGGDLPKRLVNKAMVEGPFQTTRNLKQLLESNKQITTEKQ